MMPRCETPTLEAALDGVHRAGMPGVFAEVRDGDRVWRGAAGVADLASRRPATPDLQHRVGSITKSFTAAAVLQQAENGQVALDVPIAHYLPGVVPGQRGWAITTRMLLNHTSGLAEYLPYAYRSLRSFPRLDRTTPESLDDERFTTFSPEELISWGVRAPATGAPGATPGVYSNTNYLILGQLLQKVTGQLAELVITRTVIDRAPLADTEFPAGPLLRKPHSRAYESWFGMIDPPRDYSIYDMSWVGPAAALASTVADLNTFFRLLLTGRIVGRSSVAQMQQTVPVVSQEGRLIDYGLGLHRWESPDGGGRTWGHDGSVWGAGTISMASPERHRYVSIAMNRQRWNRLDASGVPQPHALDHALDQLKRVAMGVRLSSN